VTWVIWRVAAGSGVEAEVSQQYGEARATPRAATLHCAFGDAEHGGDLRDGVSLHVQQNQRDPLLRRQLRECRPDGQRGV